MTNYMPKPREFWINLDDHRTILNAFPSLVELLRVTNKDLYMHVIEYEAYESLLRTAIDRKNVRTSYIKTLLAELEALRKERDEYRAALEDIANGSTFLAPRAREVLAKYPKESK